MYMTFAVSFVQSSHRNPESEPRPLILQAKPLVSSYGKTGLEPNNSSKMASPDLAECRHRTRKPHKRPSRGCERIYATNDGAVAECETVEMFQQDDVR